MVGPQAVKAAKERMERERERSQRRRDAAKLAVTSYYEEHMRIRRLGEQVALLKAVDEALRDFLTIGGPLASSAACEGITTMTIGCASQSRSGPLRMSQMAPSSGKAH